MTLDEAKNILINRGFIEINGGQVFDGNKWRNAIAVISKWLEQQPCEDCISRQAVLDKLNRLIEVERLQGTDEMGYGRERVSAYECMIHSIESEYLYPSVNPQQPCEDCISRQAVLDLCDMRDEYKIPYEYDDGDAHIKGYDEGRIINVTKLKMLPLVTPKEKTGKWIYDEKSRVYRCSCCNRFPWRVKLEKHDEIFTDLTRTNAYKFCPNCGAKMVEPQESEDKK